MTEFFGDGRDGNLTVTGTINLNIDATGSRSYADGIAYKVASDPTTVFISIEDTPNGFAAGDKALLINLQGGVLVITMM